MFTFRSIPIFTVMALTAFAADAPVPSPPLEILRPNAPPITLQQYRGKVVVLALILTTCSHCQQFTGVLNAVSREYSPRGVQFLECAFNPDAQATLPEFVQRFQPNFPVGYTSQVAINAYLHRSVLTTRPLYVPHLVVLDRAGWIRADYPGEDAFFRNPEAGLRALLDNLLRPASPAKATSARPSHR